MQFNFAQWLARQDKFVFNRMIILFKTLYKLLTAPRYFRGNLNSRSTTSFLLFPVTCSHLPHLVLNTCIISKLKDCPSSLLSTVLAVNIGLKDCTKTKKNCLFFRTACITGDLQLGLHITSIILFTLLLVSSKTTLNDLSIYVCTLCISTYHM